MKWPWIAAAAYLVFPFDLIPDVAPVGLLDDAAVFLGALYLHRKK